MKFVDTVKQIMATYPSINENVVDVYKHLFLTIGTEFDWVDGELVSDALSKTDGSISCTEKLLDNLNSRVKAISTVNTPARERLIDKTFANYKKVLSTITMMENSICNMSIPKDTEEPFKFSELNKYSELANLPDDIKTDWLCAAKRFVELIKLHKDLIKDESNLLDKIDARISDLCKFTDDRVDDFISDAICELNYDNVVTLEDFFNIEYDENSDTVEEFLNSGLMEAIVETWAAQNNMSVDSIIKFILDNLNSEAILNISVDKSYDVAPTLSHPTISNPNGTLLKECKFICSMRVENCTFDLEDLYLDCEIR